MLRFFVVAAFLCAVAIPAKASDLSDGISSYTDGSIAAADQLGSPDLNIGFIVLQAKSRAATSMPGKVVTPVSTASANINSVVVEEGSNVNGDIIIIDTSSGNKTQVVTGLDKAASGLASTVTSSSGSSTIGGAIGSFIGGF